MICWDLYQLHRSGWCRRPSRGRTSLCSGIPPKARYSINSWTKTGATCTIVHSNLMMFTNIFYTTMRIITFVIDSYDVSQANGSRCFVGHVTKCLWSCSGDVAGNWTSFHDNLYQLVAFALTVVLCPSASLESNGDLYQPWCFGTKYCTNKYQQSLGDLDDIFSYRHL